VVWYECSITIENRNIVARGERLNPESEKRNATINFVDASNGEDMGKSLFLGDFFGRIL
jgi:hypothetical protein